VEPPADYQGDIFIGYIKMIKIDIELDIVYLFNAQYQLTARKVILAVGGNAGHEFDLYERARVIGGITTSPWMNKTGSSNTGGQDRASTELLWLSLWPGKELRVMILTDREMADKLFKRWYGCIFPYPIKIIHCELPKRRFEDIGML
jgi:hypothetical protein